MKMKIKKSQKIIMIIVMVDNVFSNGNKIINIANCLMLWAEDSEKDKSFIRQF